MSDRLERVKPQSTRHFGDPSRADYGMGTAELILEGGARRGRVEGTNTWANVETAALDGGELDGGERRITHALRMTATTYEGDPGNPETTVASTTYVPLEKSEPGQPGQYEVVPGAVRMDGWMPEDHPGQQRWEPPYSRLRPDVDNETKAALQSRVAAEMRQFVRRILDERGE